MTRSRLDLPHPDGPSKVRNEPSAASKEMLSRAVTVRRSVTNRTVTPAQVIAARPFVDAVARPAAGRSAFEVAAIAIAGVPQPTRARAPAVASSTPKEATSLMLATRFENWPSEAY